MAAHRSSKARSPIGDGSSDANKCHADFSFPIWKEVSNPPRRVDLPINKRCMARCVISVKPERRPCQGDHPSCDCLFAHKKLNCDAIYGSDPDIHSYIPEPIHSYIPEPIRSTLEAPSVHLIR
jgi:hypothetical protein